MPFIYEIAIIKTQTTIKLQIPKFNSYSLKFDN